jgi:transposase InsO family protein
MREHRATGDALCLTTTAGASQIFGAFGGPWRSCEAVEFATLAWVDWFNNRRLLEPIGNIPPAEAEANYCAALDQPAMAA